jgi:hypothetical protein
VAAPLNTERHLRPVHEPAPTGVHEPPDSTVHDTGHGTVRDAGREPAGRRLRLAPAAGIVLRPTFWLWDGRIPQGALTLGPGREGIGKSLFCAWLAAQITRGTLPGVHEGTPKGVVYAATEDSWERTIAGRLIAADADMSRVFKVDVTNALGRSVPLSLPTDCADMAAEITANDAALLVLDPLISAVDSRIDVNGEKLREALEPLSTLADTTGASVFGLAHFNKASGTDVLSRITGSRAFSAVARAVVAFARDPGADDGSCVISQVKNNLGNGAVPSLRYLVDSITLPTVEGPGEWGRLRIVGETDAHVEAILNDTDNNGGDDRAVEYLAEQGGRAGANDIYRTGAAAGFSRDQLKRAKKRLKIEADKSTGWAWQLPVPAGGGE